ncbi:MULTISPECIES: site-specific integrase [unclassified Fusobacterium]|uniref:tyrosine-type recombinase/integrase n=1 Tax=unclassified Fusobacterium TaxID=2648384 RepID=UPI001B8D929F|nr:MULTISPECIES: site-specific integrase [unclassified Fusobacterium]MBR8700507.1 Tyrosine recombinase XerC [Fusobacterium sp. DD45]MBR8710228.1 Tyrosine recombinase XerC [Fusobacterium sp. DD28]MBR8750750.1 Tyrosine recombinase XerC [Fusobacterium sp. DD26]
MLVSGCLRNINGTYHVCLYWQENGKKKTKSFTTKIKANEKKAKKRAEDILIKCRQDYSKFLLENIKDKIQYNIETNELEIPEFTHKIFTYLDRSIEEYISLKNISDGRKIQIMYYLKRTKENLEDIPIGNLNSNFIEDFLSNYKGAVRNNFIFIFSVLNRYLLKRKIVKENFLLFIEKSKVRSKQKIILKKEEISKFLYVIKNDEFHLEFLVMLTLGLRISEVLGLKFSDISYKEKKVTINRNIIKIATVNNYQINNFLKTKNSHRTLPVPDMVLKLIKEREKLILKQRKLAGKSYNNKYLGFIFVNELGYIFDFNSYRYKLSKLCKDNNLPKLTPHSLRHTAATLLYAENVDMKNIQHFLGHSKLSTTSDIYSHYDTSKIKEISKAMENIIK